MNFSLRKLATIAFTGILFSLNNSAFAATTGMGMGPPCGPPFPPCPIPLDSGTLILLAAGAVFGGWKVYHSFKRNPA